jgi:hypothetical protein
MTEYQQALERLMRGLPGKERDYLKGSFQIGWDAALFAVTTYLMEADISDTPKQARRELNRRRAISNLHSWVTE